jgi:hypothetical protein
MRTSFDPITIPALLPPRFIELYVEIIIDDAQRAHYASENRPLEKSQKRKRDG